MKNYFIQKYDALTKEFLLTVNLHNSYKFFEIILKTTEKNLDQRQEFKQKFDINEIHEQRHRELKEIGCFIEDRSDLPEERKKSFPRT